MSFAVFPLLNLFQFICRTKVDQFHVHNQILFKSLPLGMANNVAEETFHFEILIFLFLSAKKGVFCEGGTKNYFGNCTNPFYKITRPYYKYNSPIG
jgi:hypothetical protein